MYKGKIIADESNSIVAIEEALNKNEENKI
jgi:hypothetical protein